MIEMGPMQSCRAFAAILAAVVGLTWSSIGLLGQPRPMPQYEYDAVENERRLTTLETRLDAIKAGQETTQRTEYLMLLMLAGLSGEAGVRLVKRKKVGE